MACLLLLLAVTDASCNGAIAPSEYWSLYDLFFASAGVYWAWEQPEAIFGSKWHFPSKVTTASDADLASPCVEQWQGITCVEVVEPSSYPCFVESLILNNMNMTGSISPSVANLTRLVSLVFGSNGNLVGSIPDAIGQLDALEMVSLIGNGLSHTIPSSLFTASSLREVIIQYNFFSGSIPPNVGDLVHLESLGLVSAQLTGSLPASLANATKLQSLQVTENYLTGNLDVLKGLKVAELSTNSNFFTGDLTGWSLTDLQLSFVVSINFLEGSLPSGFFRSCPITSFVIADNFFTGTISPSISLLKELTGLEISVNLLSGQLPNELGQLVALETFYGNSNMFTGTLPANLTSLPNLVDIFLYSNAMSGRLPNITNKYYAFQLLNLYENLFSGPLPGSLNNLSVVTFGANSNYLTGPLPSHFTPDQYDLTDNLLSGMIPDYLVTSKLVNELNLGKNLLTGTVSPLLFDNHLFVLDLSSNLLVGTLPTFHRNRDFYSINLCCNYFTGSLRIDIPEALGSFAEEFVLSNNSLSGPIPSNLLSSLFLTSLALDNNLFTGTIPNIDKESNNTLYLSSVLLSSNLLTGTLPESLLYLMTLFTLDLGNNLLTGEIPRGNRSYITSTTNLQLDHFYFGSNYFHGNLELVRLLPNLTVFGGELNLLTGSLEPLAHLSSLQQLIMFGNSLTGSLPSAFSTFSSLKSILVQNNSLVGQVTGIFNAAVQTTLTAVDLSSNDFTGPIPFEVFRLPLIESFASIKTCLSGSLPEAELCNATTLKYLLMDGATAGTHCQRKFSILKSSDAYVSTNGPMRGGIPACLWQLPSLEVLHLSSNGLSGTIAAPPATSALREVVLSFNQLSGTIPDSLQGLSFDILDLANNRFKGTYQGVMNNTGAQLNLKSNRLSGMMSSSFQEATDIDVMQGNLFDCDNENPKPPHDPNSAETYCGSNQLDISLMVMGFTIAFLLSITLFMLCPSRKWPAIESSQLQQSLRTREKDDELTIVIGVVRRALLLFSYANAATLELDIESIIFATEYRTLHLRLFLQLLRVCVWAAAILCFVTILALIPLYIALKLSFGQQYSTHTYQYQWLVSAAFLSGIPPTIVVIIAWIMVALAVWSVFKWTSLNDAATSQLQVDSSSLSSIRDKQLFLTRIRYAVSGLIVILNFVIIFGINYAYLTINLSTAYSSSVKTVAQIAVAAFKFLWDVTIIPMCTSELRKRIGDESQSSDAYVILKFLCYIINFVIIPGVVTVIVDSNCFLDLFVPDQEVVEAFTYSLASFQPCVTFPAIYVNVTAIGRRVEIPPTTICLSYGTPQQLTTLFNPPFSYSYQCGSAILTSYVPVLMYAYSFQGIVMPALFGTSFYFFMRQARHKTTDCGGTVSGVRRSWLESVLGRYLLGIVNPWGTTKLGESLLGGSTIVAILMQSLLILLTFGLASPPLAALVLIVVVAEVARYFVLVECFLRFHTKCGGGEHEDRGNAVPYQVSCRRSFDVNSDPRSASELNDACRDVWRATGVCFWIAFFVSSAFWGLMVFDMVGNTSANSPLKAIWAPLAVLSLPPAVFAFSRAIQRYRDRGGVWVLNAAQELKESGDDGSLRLNGECEVNNEILVDFGVEAENRSSFVELASRN